MIVGNAIRLGEQIWTGDSPHFILVDLAYDDGLPCPCPEEAEFGFIDSMGRFLDREEAYILAQRDGLQRLFAYEPGYLHQPDLRRMRELANWRTITELRQRRTEERYQGQLFLDF